MAGSPYYFSRSGLAAFLAAVEAAEDSVRALRAVERHVRADVRTRARKDAIQRAAGSAWQAATRTAAAANAARFALYDDGVPGPVKRADARKQARGARAEANRVDRLLTRARDRERG